ncbi:rhodanese-like domain-containing protein [Legionella worsleiensis]|uniref:Rhodanese domain-containing protein n=1 Tax=Legionella worsleiensis TaxID=45076 RepID=A0A0W1AIJ2_9GAMM|nr:rhodanese-like domain-containing protein [Legionella worsleiensis]KTD81173.1 Rhodanese domain-containing protein [Legionella worsleiensis]STY33149.1 rhodanese domain-containing protein [Legionella worsleiensis]
MTKHEINTVDVHELKNKMDTQSNICLIDVREHDERNDIRIPGTLHIPKDEIASRIADSVSDKSKPIYLHCRSGVRSLYAAQCLLDLGYQEVYSVNGGIMDWAMFGYPVER